MSAAATELPPDVNRMAHNDRRGRTLCIDVRSARFGYVVLEGPGTLLDSGVRSYSGQNGPLEATVRRKFLRLVDFHSPSLIVLRLAPIGSDKRNRRALRAARTLRQSIKRRSLPVRCFTRSRLKRFFHAQGLTTKHRIASHLADWFPDLAWKLPPCPRRSWQSEAYSTCVFDAAALGVFFCGKKNLRDASSETTPRPFRWPLTGV
jgi:hypothetical protein